MELRAGHDRPSGFPNVVVRTLTTMDVSIRPGDALSQPTRARVFELLGELRRPAGTDELAQRLGLHPNGIRLHLERLHDAGLVERRRQRIVRGRPRDTWTISPDARPGGDPPTGYAELARWLVRSLAAEGVRDLEATGRRIGRGLAAPGQSGRAAEERLFDALAGLGFAPERERPGDERPGNERPGDERLYRLRNCPYRAAVHERQPLVCGLHRGLTRGLLDALDPDARLVALEAKDPDLAGCLVRVRGPLARQEPAADRTR